MRAIFVLSVLSISVCVVLGQNINDMRNLPKYDSRYDYLDVDAILDSKRLVKNYVDCMINNIKCTPEGKVLKRMLPEALRTKCVRCTDRQKKTAVKVIRRLKKEYPEEWKKLEARWDPTGDFARYFEQYLTKDQSNTIPECDDNENPEPIPELPPSTARPPSTTRRPPVALSTSPKPAILNRFGEDGEPMVGSSTVMPEPSGGQGGQDFSQPSLPPMRPTMPARPTQITWTFMDMLVPTRFPLRPIPDMPPPYTTAITFIDQIGYKIIRTTELVTDILRNTVRAVVG